MTNQDADTTVWLESYRQVKKARTFYAEKAWETIKFHILLSSSLISITVGAIALMHTSDVFINHGLLWKVLLVAMLSILPFTMLEILRVGSANFERECRRMCEQNSIIMKLEERFDLRAERTEREFPESEIHAVWGKQFPEDKTYVPERYLQKWNSSCEFVEWYMNPDRSDTFYGIMNRVFRIFNLASYGLIMIIIAIAIGHIVDFSLKTGLLVL